MQALYLLSAARNFAPSHHDLLVTQLGSIDALVGMHPDELRQVELQAGRKQRLVEALKGCDPVGELTRHREQGITAIGWGTPEYPELLAELSSAPLMLFVKGDPSILKHHGIAIVGSRKCSDRGMEHAGRFGYDLAECGVPVVSGMALGIDGAAHRGALEAKGPTVAVLGCGVDVLYPKRHHELYNELCEKACVVSEYIPGTGPLKEHFPQRNRIISGLSKGTLVVEAPIGSGALITAKCAVDQGRDVFAVPGPVGSPYVKGTHHLIKTGQAKLTEGVDDILVEYGTNRAVLRRERAPQAELPFSGDGAVQPEARGQSASGGTTAQPADVSGAEQAVLNALSYEGTHVNDLVRKLKLTTQECIAHLTLLEIKGLVSKSGGGFYTRL